MPAKNSHDCYGENKNDPLANCSKLFYHVATKIVFPEYAQSYADEICGYTYIGMTKTVQI